MYQKSLSLYYIGRMRSAITGFGSFDTLPVRLAPERVGKKEGGKRRAYTIFQWSSTNIFLNSMCLRLRVSSRVCTPYLPFRRPSLRCRCKETAKIVQVFCETTTRGTCILYHGKTMTTTTTRFHSFKFRSVYFSSIFSFLRSRAWRRKRVYSRR